MDPIEHDCKVRCLVQQGLKVFDGFHCREIERELDLDLFVYITSFDIRDVGVNHESDEIYNSVHLNAEKTQNQITLSAAAGQDPRYITTLD